VKRSLFIANDYLRFKRRKLNFLHRPSLKNKQTANSGRRGAWGSSKCQAHERLRQPLMYDFLRFRPVLYCSSIWTLQGTWNEFSSPYIVFKNLLWTIGLQFHILVLSCDVLICQLTWFSLQNAQNTYGVAWSRIKVNYNDSSENNTICSSNHWQLL